MKTLIGIIVVVFSLAIFGVVIVKKITLKQNCTGYLKRAADANTVEMANKEIGKAIAYLEDNNLTAGYTSVLYRTPDEDIEFWYSNLKASQSELSKITNETSSLEKSNLLMKLRETLIDNGDKGDNLTVPDGLSRYPHNLLYGILMFIATIIILGGITVFLAEL